jgi:hypothetical protein
MNNKFEQTGIKDSTFGDYAQIEIQQTINPLSPQIKGLYETYLCQTISKMPK